MSTTAPTLTDRQTDNQAAYLVAVDDSDRLVALGCDQLTDCGLTTSCLSNQQHWLALIVIIIIIVILGLGWGERERERERVSIEHTQQNKAHSTQHTTHNTAHNTTQHTTKQNKTHNTTHQCCTQRDTNTHSLIIAAVIAMPFSPPSLDKLAVAWFSLCLLLD